MYKHQFKDLAHTFLICLALIVTSETKLIVPW
jgi:hypothetical protein